MFSQVSLIITTYNWPQALKLVLNSVLDQIVLPYEVIIADDGSTEETTALINQFQSSFPCPLKHIWQEDIGYRGAKIRNKAVNVSSGDYLIFIDGDCLLRVDFIQQQNQLAKAGYFISGNRVLLSEAYTQELLTHQLNITSFKAFDFTSQQLNRRWALLRFSFSFLRYLRTKKWEGAKSCNLSLPATDFINVNGFDESFKGWGHEDSDLVIRLIKNGTERKSGRFAVTVLHLYHPTIKSADQDINWARLQATLLGKRYLSQRGLNKIQDES